MKEIKINISKAVIHSFTVTLKDNLPVVSVSVRLLTEGGKAIADYGISSESWTPETKFDLPAEMVFPILEIAEQLEKIVVAHCQSATKQLPAPMQVIEATADDIPF